MTSSIWTKEFRSITPKSIVEWSNAILVEGDSGSGGLDYFPPPPIGGQRLSRRLKAAASFSSPSSSAATAAAAERAASNPRAAAREGSEERQRTWMVVVRTGSFEHFEQGADYMTNRRPFSERDNDSVNDHELTSRQGNALSASLGQPPLVLRVRARHDLARRSKRRVLNNLLPWNEERNHRCSRGCTDLNFPSSELCNIAGRRTTK